jgi:hypothetical protein
VSKKTSPKIPWWSSATAPILAVLREPVRKKAKRFVLITFLIVPIALAAFVNPATSSRSVSGGGEREPASLVALANGCTGVTSWAGSGSDGYVDQPIESFTWEITPPSRGNFAVKPWEGNRASFVVSEYSPNVPEVLASLYRGDIVIWYNSAKTEDLPALLNDAREMTEEFSNLIIAPWPLDEDSTNPWRSPRPIVFSSWGKTLGCLTFDRAVLEEFMLSASERVAPDVALGKPGPKADLVTRPSD